MRRIIDFILAVAKHWGALVTGGAAIGLISIWQETGHRVPAYVYWSIALLALFVAFFRAWKDKAEQVEGATAKAHELEQKRIATVDSAEWLDLADRFKEISRHVGAQLQTTSELREQFGKDTNRSDRWSMGVGGEEKKCEALCVLAGAMLVKSPNQSISAEVRAVTSDRDRWLGFLAECGAVRSDSYAIEPISEDRKQIHYFGYITELAVVSANICIECSSREL
jgi:hypothetical protein